MFKGYKAFVKNQGLFEPPGARALQDFKNLYDAQLEVARVQAVRAAEIAAVQEAKARQDDADAQTIRASGESTPSVETVLRVRLFPEVFPRSDTTREHAVFSALRAPTQGAVPAPPASPARELGSPICSICSRICDVRPNPWQRTRTHIAVSKVVAIERPTPVRYGIALEPCDHIFCGACLAQAIYHSMNMAFDPATYGTKLPSYEHDVPGLGRDPVPCPTCQSEKRAKPVHISDTTARLVLGDANMEEWNQARFLRTINLIYCPHKGCHRAFDVDDVVPAGVLYAPNRVQCPRCKGSLCKACKSVWHENLTCLMYQASPVQEGFSESSRDRQVVILDSRLLCHSCNNRRAAIFSPTEALTPWPREQRQLVAT